MKDLTPASYGDAVADIYDERTPDIAPAYQVTDETLAVLVELAGEGPALELGIGTGRLALPLLEHGVPVHGVDASEAMVARLRDKSRGDEIPVTIGDMKDVEPEGPFTLVFVVFNSFFGLLTQDDQVTCFRNVADRLVGGGYFLIEAFVPDVTRFDRGQRFQTRQVELDWVEVEAAKHDLINQRVDSQLVEIRADGNRYTPIAIRYAYPSELDLMARLAGMVLTHRWNDWDRTPFDGSLFKHVSVYQRER